MTHYAGTIKPPSLQMTRWELIAVMTAALAVVATFTYMTSQLFSRPVVALMVSTLIGLVGVALVAANRSELWKANELKKLRGCEAVRIDDNDKFETFDTYGLLDTGYLAPKGDGSYNVWIY